MKKQFLLAVCLLSTLLAAEKRVLINGIAATIGTTVITIHDVYLYRALQRFCDRQSPAIVSEEGETLKKSVQKVVFEQMVYNELVSFQFAGEGRGTTENMVAKARKEGGDGSWQEILSRFSVSEAEAIDRIYRISQVEKFLQKKVDTLTQVITDAEVEKYFTQNAERFRGSSLEQLKPSIVLLLKKERAQKGLEEWVRFLKDKYRVQNALDS